MSDDGTKRIYPSKPLEEIVAAATHEQLEQPLLETKNTATTHLPPNPPPTYDQATESTPAETAGPHVVVVTQAVSPYGPNPTDIMCPHCHNYCRTRIRYKPTSRTHLIALVLCLFQLYCCICVPYCIGSCMNTNHYCGMCDKYLGTYVR